MDRVLRPHQRYAAEHLDDVVVSSRDWETHCKYRKCWLSFLWMLKKEEPAQYPLIKSRVVINLALPSWPINSTTCGIESDLNTDTSFSFLKSLQNHIVPSGLGTSTIGLDQALWDSSMTPSFSIFLTSFLIASHQTSGTLYGRWCMTLPGIVQISCWITWVWPGSEEKTSLFRSTNSNVSCSCCGVTDFFSWIINLLCG